MGGMMGFGFVGAFLMLLFWGVLIFGAIWIIRALFPDSQRRQTREDSRELSALEILDLRYARGEIDREEYELKKSDLVG